MANRSHKIPFSLIKDWAGQGQAEHMEGESLVKMVQADLSARRISIDDCRDIIQHLHDQDLPTRQGLQGVLAVKGQRAGDAENRAAKIGADMERKTTQPQSS